MLTHLLCAISGEFSVMFGGSQTMMPRTSKGPGRIRWVAWSGQLRTPRWAGLILSGIRTRREVA